jgi:anti-sigma factor RsiW
MTGRDWSVELTAYVDGELSAEERKLLEAELARDPSLRALLAKLERTVAAVEALPSPAPSAAMRRAVLLELERPTWRERLGAWLSPGRLVPSAALAAVAVAVVVVATRPAVPARVAMDEEQLEVAQNLEVLEDLDLAGLDGAEDVEVVARLQELEKEP